MIRTAIRIKVLMAVAGLAVFGLLVGTVGVLLVGAVFDGASSSSSRCGQGVAPPGDGAVRAPMADGSYRLSSGFGPRWGGFHQGTDFAAASGTPYTAAADGVVVRAGPASGFGQWIVVDSTVEGELVSTVYGHSFPDQLLVGQGDRVTAGQPIGEVGNNGQSTGPHMHFEVWPGGRFAGGRPIDPMPWLQSTATTGDGDEDEEPVVDDAELLPDPVRGQVTMRIDDEARTNVATIVGVVKGRELPLRAGVVAVATAMQESLLHNIDYGDRDSLGLFQQRPSQGWGTREQILDPVYSTGKFLDGLVALGDWRALPLTVAAQQVQRSAFPDAYAKWEQQAAELVAAATGVDPITAGLGPGASDCGVDVHADGPVIPADLVVDTSWEAEAATVPDPVIPTARITPRTAVVVDAVRDGGWDGGGLGCWDQHAWNPASDHPLGRACDVMFAHPDPDAIARGWALANHLVANQAELGIRYLIWQGRFWSASSPLAWTEYRSGVYGCPDPADVTGCHYDHVHISVY